ncbi:hypothetical protein GL263_19735 [Streptomyces durbertensis]|uniref:Uncharacterized protein n=1 Tax=Streptomyces durbertensis TaxID=2448886 RepID=A0ABR6EKC5_9ACTN|nr:hypothetical protein [Streptomyces durbertensis]MBB1245771.1 hypothetical protein [Streptomyces durbertensis]
MGLGTENFGSNCLFYFGEAGRRAEQCHQVNDRAREALPPLVVAAWASAVLTLLYSGVRRWPHRAGVAVAFGCLAAAVVLGWHAVVVSSP